MRAKVVTFVASMVVVVLCNGNAAAVEHDGQWWREQNQTEKARYAARLFDGMTVGSNLLEFGMSAQVVVQPAASSQQSPVVPQYVRFDGGQLSEYIDRFYADPRNATITVARAGRVFLQSVAGIPRADLQKMIEDYRKSGC